MSETEHKSLTFKADLGNMISAVGFLVTVGVIVFNFGKRDARLDYLSEAISKNLSLLVRIESKTDSLTKRLGRVEWSIERTAILRDQQWTDIYRRMDLEEADTRERNRPRDRSAAVKPVEPKAWPKDWNDLERIRLARKTPGPTP